MNQDEDLTAIYQGITLTPKALTRAKELACDDEFNGLSLRLYLDGKGCDGFFYGVTFSQSETEDLHFFVDGIDLVVDPDTIEFVDGSCIDWVDDERGAGFLVENPNHKKFRGKFYKRSAWQEKLTAKLEQKRQQPCQ